MTEEEIKSAVGRVEKIFSDLETETINIICERIGKIGKISETDFHRLNQLSRIGRDVDDIERRISAATGRAQDEIDGMFTVIAENEYNSTRKTFKTAGAAWVPFSENASAQALVKASIESVKANVASAAGLSASISGTIGFINSKENWQPLAQYYQDTVDFAIMQIRTGQTDFHTAMGKSIKKLSDNGMCYHDKRIGRRYVSYESGYNRRLDSSVRNAISGGLQRMSVQLAEERGKEFGADGYEISYHAGARPSHEWIGGIKVDKSTFEHDVIPLLEDFNCYHRAFPIILGVSVPAYSGDELSALKAQDHETHVFEGKKYDGYEARQKQRQFETALRREKDRAIAFKTTGDKYAEGIAKAKASAINQRYEKFSRAVELDIKPKRASVSGYTRGANRKRLDL